MDTTWLKIAGIVVILIVIVVVGANWLGKNRPAAQSQSNPTIEQVWQQDEQRLNAPVQQPNEPTTVQPQLVFRPLTEEQTTRAEQLWQMVVTSRKMGRLPGMTYGQMVQYCRQIINEFPGSEYAYRAKLALADIPESARRQYNITDKELDVSGFYKQ
ncbi:MAG: hypothetical protein QHH07_09830 [Sedimentisphaerales bacterium]|nr:hypothetical protein [Sedimentisphaerales bacterium]